MHSTEITTPARLRAALGKTAFKAVFGAAVAAGMLGAGQAQAFHVTVNGQRWNVQFFDGTQGGPNAALFQTAANGGRMPWFTNNALSCGTSDANLNNCLAIQFSNAVGTQLNGGTSLLNLRFAFSGMTSTFSALGADPPDTGTPCPNVDFTSPNCPRTGQFISIRNGVTTLDTEPQKDVIARWAYADLVPGPLPLFGVAAAFGFSRKLRKRINDSKAAGSSFPAA
jgi:hypothetical protein